MGAGGRETHRPFQEGLPVDLPLRLRPSPERAGLLDDPTHGDNRAVLFGALGVREKEVGAGKERRILLVVGQAGWHTGAQMQIPEGIHLEFLPKGSPELMPAERGCGR